MSKKYELVKDLTIEHEGHTLYRIRALRGFVSPQCYIEADTIGGWIESEDNLSQDGLCWVHGDSMVYGEAKVSGDSVVRGLSIVKDNALVKDRAQVRDSMVYDYASVENDASLLSGSRAYGRATLRGRARVSQTAQVYENAVVINARVFGGVVKGDATVEGQIDVGRVTIAGVARIKGAAVFRAAPSAYGRSDTVIKGRDDWMTFGNVGSEHGVLTVYLAGDVLVCTRGCFTGTATDFMRAVRHEHGSGPIAQEYALMIQVAKLRLRRPALGKESSLPACEEVVPAVQNLPKPAAADDSCIDEEPILDEEKDL